MFVWLILFWFYTSSIVWVETDKSQDPTLKVQRLLHYADTNLIQHNALLATGLILLIINWSFYGMISSFCVLLKLHTSAKIRFITQKMAFINAQRLTARNFTPDFEHNSVYRLESIYTVFGNLSSIIPRPMCLCLSGY